MLAAIMVVAISAELGYVIVNFSAMPIFIRSIGLPDRWIAIMGMAFLVVEGLLKSPFGALGDRLGRKVMIMAGPCVTIVTTLITPHIHNPYVLLTLRVLDGIGAAALWPACFSLIGDYVPEERRASAMNLFNLSYVMGIALGPLIGGGINDLTGTKTASFYVATCLFVLTVLSALILLPAGRPAAAQGHRAGEGGHSFADFRRMLARMPDTLLTTFTIFMGVGLVTNYVKVFTMDTLHISESAFGRLLLGPALVIAVLSIKLGTLGDRIGKAAAVKVGLGLCAGAYTLLLVTFNGVTVVVLGALVGLGFVIAFPSWMALVTSSCDESQRGAAVGAVGTAQGLGVISGVAIVIAGRLYERPGLQVGPITIPPHGLPFVACGLMLILAFALAMTTVRDPHCDTTILPPGQ
jgi:MFS family permease